MILHHAVQFWHFWSETNYKISRESVCIWWNYRQDGFVLFWLTAVVHSAAYNLLRNNNVHLSMVCAWRLFACYVKCFAFSDGPRRDSAPDVDAAVHDGEILLVCPVNKYAYFTWPLIATISCYHSSFFCWWQYCLDVDFQTNDDNCAIVVSLVNSSKLISLTEAKKYFSWMDCNRVLPEP